MKATEIKIGDWVSFADVPVKVKEVKQDGVCVDLSCFDNSKGEQGYVEFGDLSPIPLTSEILEKNGWIYYETQNYWEYTGKFEFTLVYRDGKGFTIEQIPYITFQSTHELQHLLWALGMDDDLKI